LSDEVMINLLLWTGMGPANADHPSPFVLEPQADLLRLNTSGKVDGVVLTDVQGRAMDLRPGGAMLTWSTAHYAAGFYIVRAIVDDDPVSLRFVLND
jgi:hypothetical protein